MFAPLPNIGLGEGAALNFGADGGPIHSSDRFDNSFSTGAFGNEGAGTVTQIALFAGGAAIAVILTWLILSSRR